MDVYEALRLLIWMSPFEGHEGGVGWVSVGRFSECVVSTNDLMRETAPREVSVAVHCGIARLVSMQV